MTMTATPSNKTDKKSSLFSPRATESRNFSKTQTQSRPKYFRIFIHNNRQNEKEKEKVSEQKKTVTKPMSNEDVLAAKRSDILNFLIKALSH